MRIEHLQEYFWLDTHPMELCIRHRLCLPLNSCPHTGAAVPFGPTVVPPSLATRAPNTYICIVLMTTMCPLDEIPCGPTTLFYCCVGTGVQASPSGRTSSRDIQQVQDPFTTFYGLRPVCLFMLCFVFASNGLLWDDDIGVSTGEPPMEGTSNAQCSISFSLSSLILNQVARL